MLDNITTARLRLAGLRQEACRLRIIEALESVPGVLDAEVSLMRARAKVRYESPCRPAHLISAVLCAGYAADVDGLAET